jgi:AcrR family transcriptional regulator
MRFHVKAPHMGSDDQRWQRPRSYHHGNLKEVLLEAARKLIEQYGPAGFSLTEAARLAGVSPAAPYRHFRDREALLAEVARNGFERFAARLDMAWNNGIPTPLSAFENLGRAYLAFAREEPASYAVMFEASLGPGEDEALKAAAERAFDVLQRAATALVRALPADQRPPVRLMSLHVWALSHGVAALFVEACPGVAKLPLPPEDILESAMLIYLRGLGVLSPESGEMAPNP